MNKKEIIQFKKDKTRLFNLLVNYENYLITEFIKNEPKKLLTRQMDLMRKSINHIKMVV